MIDSYNFVVWKLTLNKESGKGVVLCVVSLIFNFIITVEWQ